MTSIKVTHPLFHGQYPLRICPSRVRLHFEIAGTLGTRISLVHENEHRPYVRRSVVVELTEDQLGMLGMRYSGQENGRWIYEEILGARLEGWPEFPFTDEPTEARRKGFICAVCGEPSGAPVHTGKKTDVLGEPVHLPVPRDDGEGVGP